MSENTTPTKPRVSITNILITAFLFILMTVSASAAVFTVNGSADTNDANTGDSNCADTAGNCTLRAAIEQANASVGSDTITFSLAAPSTINLTLGELSITEDVTIFGAGARNLIVQRSATAGTPNFRVFRISGATGTFVFISGMTIANGNVSNGSNQSGFEFLGGGFANFPGNTLDLLDVAVRNNRANYGGGIFNGGTLNLRRVTINNNSALQGGGLNISSNSVTNINNSTISDNSANAASGTQGIGGGILLLNGILNLTNATVSHNTATDFGGGISSGENATGLRNTIVANNTAGVESPDVRGSFESLGNNLIGNNFGSAGFPAGNPNANADKVGTAANPINPLLGPLQDNGGQTDTRSIALNSPAKDAGNNCVTDSTCPTNNPTSSLLTDQRGSGFPRRVGAAVDIGAFEAQFPVPVITQISPFSWGVGGGGFQLIVLGNNFVPESVVRFNGQNRVTTYISQFELRAQILPSDVAAIGQFPITVFNPEPVGGSSNAVLFTVTNCTYTLNPTAFSIGAAGGTGTFNVETLNECSYTVTSNASWITITSQPNGTGPGAVNFTVAANPGNTRTGTITVNGQTFTITQNNGCTYSVMPTSANFQAAGGTGSFNVLTSDPTCPWTAASNVPWIIVSNGSGTGNGTVNYTVSTNTVASRTGNITVNGQIFTVNQAAAPAAIRTPFDFDGDNRADVAVFRPNGAIWYILNSQSGNITTQQFGVANDIPAAADFDGDGKYDIAVFRPSTGQWIILFSASGQFSAINFGANGDIPVPGDFDGDGKADISVFRPSNGFWYRQNSSNGAFVAIQFGTNGDIPLRGDFDGDRKADLAVFRPSTGIWYRINSVDNTFAAVTFGAAGDIPTPADYDGDFRADISVFRPSNATWYRLNSSNNQFVGQTFGTTEDKPVAADYDGDGRADIAVFRPSIGTWYIQRSTAGFTGVQFGSSTDIPVTGGFNR